MSNFKPKNKKYVKGDKKPYTKKPRAKQQTSILTFEREFEDLRDLIIGFKALHPEIESNIFPYNEDEIDPKNMIEDVLNYFTKNCIPDIIQGSNLFCSINVSANRVTLKTNKFFTIGWNYKFDRNGFVTDIKATVTVFSREKNSEALNSMIEVLNDRWTVVTNENK